MSVDMAVKVLDESINKIVLIKLKGTRPLEAIFLALTSTWTCYSTSQKRSILKANQRV